MTIHEALRFACHYFYQPHIHERPEDEFKLNRGLQYLLCIAYDRINKQFGEVTRKDISLLCESWVMAQGTDRPEKPLVHCSIKVVSGDQNKKIDTV